MHAKKFIGLFTSFVLAISATGCSIMTEKQQPVIIIDDNEQPIQEDIDISKFERGGSLSLVICNFDTLNPILTTSSTVDDAMKLVFEPLFTLDGKLSAVPVLANSYTVNADATEYTISLKDNIRWHDDKDFTAADVEYTINAIENSNSVYKFNLENVASHAVIDNKTYYIKLSKPVANFVSLLDFPIIQKNSNMDADNKKYVPIGTGPYKYSSITGVREVTLIANGSWHDGTNPAYIERILLKTLPAKSSASFSFDAREVEVLTDDVVNLQEYLPQSNAVVHTYTSNTMCFLGINFYNSIFWGKSTRQALGYIIDKEKIASNVLLGHARVVDVPINPQSWAYGEQTRVYKEDKIKARTLLAEDGWKYSIEKNAYMRNFNGTEQRLEIEILVNNDNNIRMNIAKNIAESLKEVGWLVNIKEVGFEEYSTLIKDKNFDIFIGELDMSANMDLSFLLGSEGNYFTYGNEEMDKYLHDARTAPDKKSAEQAYANISKLFIDDVPFLPLYFAEASLIYDFKIEGMVKPTVNNPYNNIHLWYVNNKK